MARNRLRQQALETLIFLARAFHSGKWQRLTQNWPSANDNSVTKVKERFEEEEVEAAKSVSCSFDLCLVKRSRGQILMKTFFGASNHEEEIKSA